MIEMQEWCSKFGQLDRNGLPRPQMLTAYLIFVCTLYKQVPPLKKIMLPKKLLNNIFLKLKRKQWYLNDGENAASRLTLLRLLFEVTMVSLSNMWLLDSDEEKRNLLVSFVLFTYF